MEPTKSAKINDELNHEAWTVFFRSLMSKVNHQIDVQIHTGLNDQISDGTLYLLDSVTHELYHGLQPLGLQNENRAL